MNKKLAIRSAIAVVLFGALFIGYNMIQKVSDFDPGTVATPGWIVAVEETDEGSQAVVFDSDGNERRSPGYQPKFQERDAVWNKAGDRVFFVADREDETFHIYRWNLSRNEVRRRTLDSRSKGTPFFGTTALTGSEDLGLITAGGRVLMFDPKEGSTRQLLPPMGREVGRSEDGGSVGQFDQLYERFGQSFKAAKWGKDRRWIAAVMQRAEGGQVLIVQSQVIPEDATPEQVGYYSLPHAVIAGERVDFDVSPTTGAIVFSVHGFDFPDASNPPEAFVNEKGEVVRPFRNVVGFVDPDDPTKTPNRFSPSAPGMVVMAATPDDETIFREPAVSPDGTRIAAVLGRTDENGLFAPGGLILMDLAEASGSSGTGLLQGPVSSPSWHPDGNTIVFLMRDGARSIYTVSRTGGEPKRVSDGKKNYSSVSFSPQS